MSAQSNIKHTCNCFNTNGVYNKRHTMTVPMTIIATITPLRHSSSHILYLKRPVNILMTALVSCEVGIYIVPYVVFLLIDNFVLHALLVVMFLDLPARQTYSARTTISAVAEVEM